MKTKKREPVVGHPTQWRNDLYKVIFEAETPVGKMFDVVLLWAIFISVFIVVMESVSVFRIEYGVLFHNVEWFFTGLFTVEYILRLICVKRPSRYIFSFFGVVDFLATIPTYLGLFFVGAQSLLVIRALRLLRVFRVLKLGRYLSEFDVLIKAIKASKNKILVFLITILTLTVIMGTMMYLIEGEAHGFTSIPRSIYWAIVTITTVGYGDIAPQTVIGQILAAFVMMIGYAIIIVPTGIFSAELSRIVISKKNLKKCQKCLSTSNEENSIYCHLCGEKL